MKIDVVKLSFDSVQALASVHSFIYFKNNYLNWFNGDSTVYIRYVGKTFVGQWKLLPNRSYDFYRCPKVTSQDLINKLDEYFGNNLIRGITE